MFLKRILVFCILCCSFYSFAQELEESNTFSVFDVDTKSNYRVDLLHQKMDIMNPDSSQKNLPLKFNHVNLNDIEEKLIVRSFKKSSQEFYILVNGTGQIYLLNIADRTLNRIDRTFYRGYNFFSVPVFRKDTIFSFGGFGFCHMNNIPTFYDAKLNQWELYTISNSEATPARIVSKIGGYHPSLDKIYAASIDQLYSSNNKHFPVPFFEFDFKTKKWNKLGTIKSLSSVFLQYDHLDLIWTGQFFFSNDFTSGQFIDPANNRKYKYIGKKKFLFARNIKLLSTGTYLYSFQNHSEQNHYKIFVDSIHVDSLLKDSVLMGSFYVPTSKWDSVNFNLFAYLILLVVIILLTALLVNSKSRNTIVSNSKNIDLPEHSLEFLTFILNEKKSYLYDRKFE
jgi:hypothetical protein